MNPQHTEAAGTGHTTFEPRVDRVTYEILKHRLWQINEEQATTIRRVSGSPIASEVQDYNVGIATADGQLVACGMSVLAHVSALTHVIRNCRKVVSADRMRPGDMFITNDPWMGAVHQNDVVLVAPLFENEVIVGWAGSVIHHADVGGPAPGSWNLDATDVYQEAPRFRFLRVVEDGEIVNEVMETVLTNSRTPGLVELDLRAQVAAAGVVRRRMAEIFTKYGVEPVCHVMEDSLDDTEMMLRRRLAEIPDGTWHAEEHVDHDGRSDTVSTVRVTLRKTGETLAFDFSDSDPQAAGLINCTRPTLEASPMAAVMTHLCAGLTWNEGVMRVIDTTSRSGTVVDCDFPAPVASGVINAGWAALNAAAAAVARMMLGAEGVRDQAMAGWAGAPYGVNVFGVFEDGRPFGTMLGLSGLQGAGARTFADGYDSAGYLQSPRCGAMNVETAEARYPILHLFRKLAPDSGGAGTYRGGRGVEMGIVTHHTASAEIIVTSFGNDHSGSPGLAGGMPGGGANGVLVKTNHDLTHLCSTCTDRQSASAAGKVDPLPSKARVALQKGEIFLAITHGGGGYGDPLDRTPEAVAHDVATGAVTPDSARTHYGVALGDDGHALTEDTAALREKMRANRPTETALGPFLTILDGAALICPHCHAHSALQLDSFDPSLVTTQPLSAANPLIALRWDGDSPRFRLVTIHCPSCGHRCETAQIRTGD